MRKRDRRGSPSFLRGAMATPIRIDNSTVSDRAWGEVDKAALARRLAENGDASAIREALAYVPDGSTPLTTGLENRSEWGRPHHELQGDTLVVSRNGVHALAAARAAVRPVGPEVGVGRRDACTTGGVEGLHVLGGKGRDVGQRALAHPSEQGPALGRGDIDSLGLGHRLSLSNVIQVAFSISYVSIGPE